MSIKLSQHPNGYWFEKKGYFQMDGEGASCLELWHAVSSAVQTTSEEVHNSMQSSLQILGLQSEATAARFLDRQMYKKVRDYESGLAEKPKEYYAYKEVQRHHAGSDVPVFYCNSSISS